MTHHLEKMRAPRVLTFTRCSAVLGFALALGGCSSRLGAGAGTTKPEATEASAGGVSAEHALSRPSPTLAKRASPAGLAMATLGLFHDDELDQSQKVKLAALRADVVSAQRDMGAEIVTQRDASRSGTTNARDLGDLGSVMAERQHQLVDRALAGALELSATLTADQRLGFVVRAEGHARSARHLASRLVAGSIADGRGDDRVTLAQDRATILEELARPAPDVEKVRSLGSAFVAAHAHGTAASVIVSKEIQ